MTEAIVRSAVGIDLSPRIVSSTTVVASPAAGAETIVGSLTLPAGLTINAGVLLLAWVAATIGTSGVSANVRIRQTNVSGAIIAATGATTVVATNLVESGCQGFDTAPVDGQVYKLTLAIGSGAASSTVSAVQLVAIAI